MTEEQARQKWCPMVRIVSVDFEDKDSRNRISGAASIIPDDCLCIGSDCMMWRTVQSNVKDMPLDDVNFTVRTTNVLKNDGIFMLSDLLKRSETDLLRMPNLGRRSLNEIVQDLELRGLCLGTPLRTEDHGFCGLAGKP